MSPFFAWVDFQARSRFARSTIPDEKWGTTRSLSELYASMRSADCQDYKMTVRLKFLIVIHNFVNV